MRSGGFGTGQAFAEAIGSTEVYVPSSPNRKGDLYSLTNYAQRRVRWTPVWESGNSKNRLRSVASLVSYFIMNPGQAGASRDPLHGMTLEKILERLVEHYGWQELGERIPIRCFNFDPSIPSSLQFLRRTPWARTKVEKLYVEMVRAG